MFPIRPDWPTVEIMIVFFAKVHFMDVLPDEDMHLHIRQSHAYTLQQALEIALELESYSLANHREKLVREVHLETEGQSKVTKSDTGSDIVAHLESM